MTLKDVAKKAVEAYLAWVTADGFDCPELDDMKDEMSQLARNLDMKFDNVHPSQKEQAHASDNKATQPTNNLVCGSYDDACPF